MPRTSFENNWWPGKEAADFSREAGRTPGASSADRYRYSVHAEAWNQPGPEPRTERERRRRKSTLEEGWHFSRSRSERANGGRTRDRQRRSFNSFQTSEEGKTSLPPLLPAGDRPPV